MDNKNVSPLLTAKIVRSYVRHHTVGATQLPDLIATVHRSLGELGQQPIVEEPLTPAVPVRQSVRRDYVVCLDCGYRGQMLRRHLTSRHGLSRVEYLKRWALSPDHPLTAPAYSEHRSVLAKELGLGRKPKSKAGAASVPSEAGLGNGEGKNDANQPTPKKPRQRRSRSRATSAPA